MAARKYRVVFHRAENTKFTSLHLLFLWLVDKGCLSAGLAAFVCWSSCDSSRPPGLSLTRAVRSRSNLVSRPCVTKNKLPSLRTKAQVGMIYKRRRNGDFGHQSGDDGHK